MSKEAPSEVHAVWNCPGCNWMKETVVELEAGRDFLQWSGFEQDHRPQHNCQRKFKAHLLSIQWFSVGKREGAGSPAPSS